MGITYAISSVINEGICISFIRKILPQIAESHSDGGESRQGTEKTDHQCQPYRGGSAAALASTKEKKGLQGVIESGRDAMRCFYKVPHVGKSLGVHLDRATGHS